MNVIERFVFLEKLRVENELKEVRGCIRRLVGWKMIVIWIKKVVVEMKKCKWIWESTRGIIDRTMGFCGEESVREDI